MEWALQLGDEKVKKQYRDPMSQSLVSINILSRIMPKFSMSIILNKNIPNRTPPKLYIGILAI